MKPGPGAKSPLVKPRGGATELHWAWPVKGTKRVWTGTNPKGAAVKGLGYRDQGNWNPWKGPWEGKFSGRLSGNI